MNKYTKIFWRVFRMSFMQAMIYKQDFILASFTTLVYMGTQLFLIWMFFEAGGIDLIGGYSMRDIFLIFVLLQLVVAFIFTFVHTPAMKTIRQIHMGELDYFLTKPVDSRFMISVQNFQAVQSYVIFLYVPIMLYFLLMGSAYDFSNVDVIMIFYVLIVGFMLYAMMYWVAAIVHLIWPRFWGPWMFMGNVGDIMKYPKNVYPGFVRMFLTYIVPVFVVVNPIYKIIDGTFGWIDFVQINLILVMFGFFYLIIWHVGLKRYNSAN